MPLLHAFPASDRSIAIFKILKSFVLFQNKIELIQTSCTYVLMVLKKLNKILDNKRLFRYSYYVTIKLFNEQLSIIRKHVKRIKGLNI